MPDQGSNPRPLQWKCRVITTGPGKSLRNLSKHTQAVSYGVRLCSKAVTSYSQWGSAVSVGPGHFSHRKSEHLATRRGLSNPQAWEPCCSSFSSFWDCRLQSLGPWQAETALSSFLPSNISQHLVHSRCSLTVC